MNVGELFLGRSFAERPHKEGKAIIQVASLFNQLLQHFCQGKVEMSPSRQSRNVPFSLGLGGVHVNLRVPVKRRRAMLASNPIKE
jgi:hypothetical protein